MTRIFVFTLSYLCTYIGYGQHTENLQNLYYQGDYEACTNILVDDELLEPQDLFIIANAFHKMQDYESAIMYYDKSTEVSKTEQDYHLNRAICEISVGDLESAERSLFLFEDKVGNHPMVHYYFSVIDYEVMEYKTALESIDYALEIDQDYYEAWFLKGAIYAELDKYEKAQECFNQVLEINPYHGESQLYLAMSLIHTQDYEQATDILDSLIAENKDLKAEAIFYKAEASFYTHDLDSACNLWNESANLGDEYARANIKLICEKGKVSRHRARKVQKISL